MTPEEAMAAISDEDLDVLADALVACLLSAVKRRLAAQATAELAVTEQPQAR